MKHLLVGGAVRDRLLGIPVAEQDWVVLGETPESMLKQGYRQVGKSFPVFLHPHTGDEYALARTEQNTGPGHQNFAFNSKPDVTLEEDLYRRDLTINAMAETADGIIIDPYGGQSDLSNRLLRHVSPAFDEDPLRVFRLARFYAKLEKFGFQVDDQTRLLCSNMVDRGDIDSLSPERIFMELDKVLKTEHPEKFFTFIEDIGAAAHLWPDMTQAAIARMNLIAINLEPAQKFACLCLDLTETSLQKINDKVRLPKQWQDLNILLTRHYQQLVNSDLKSPAHIVTTLEHLDARRKPERFEKILKIIEALQPIQSNIEIAAKWRQWQALCAQSQTKNLPRHVTGVEIKTAIRASHIAIIASHLRG